MIELSKKTTEVLLLQQELLSSNQNISNSSPKTKEIPEPLKVEKQKITTSVVEEIEETKPPQFSFPEPKPSIISYITNIATPTETTNKVAPSLDDFMDNSTNDDLNHIVNKLDDRNIEKKSFDYLDQMLDYKKKPEEMIQFVDEKKGSILGLFGSDTGSNQTQTPTETQIEKTSFGGLDDFF